jgi:prolyl-tRNA editing enzyme YbaK/EbsC (Cys-tRNA(Pro) deacylase)
MAVSTPASVAAAILERLHAAGAEFEELAHAEARSAEEAARVRGTPLQIGGKSLVMKLDRGIGFAVLVLGGDHRLDNRALRRHLGLRRYRFASRSELAALTGLTPGCVPPFGRPIFDLPLFVDAATAAREEIVFSLATHTRSVHMATASWLAAADPADVFSFAEPDRR